MKNIDFINEKLERLFGVDFIGLEGSFGERVRKNPVCCSKWLQEELIRGAQRLSVPYIYMDEFDVCFACIKRKENYYGAGPMLMRNLSSVEWRQFCHKYGIDGGIPKPARTYLLQEIFGIIQLAGLLILDKGFTDEELIRENPIDKGREIQTERAQAFLSAYEEERSHHTYEEERRLLDCVRAGQVEDAVYYSNKMDTYLGRLSGKDLNHWKNAAVAGITLCTRAAIQGGLSPGAAYRLSDFFIQKSDACAQIHQVILCRNRAVRELTESVLKNQMLRSSSNYVERCKDYVEKHYRSKIYVKDIAVQLGISPGYLSRLFHAKTGIRLQDHIIQVRLDHGANLLMYSDESIARIAEYVNFPSQSYFGKVFKQYKHMSPRQFREKYKPSGF